MQKRKFDELISYFNRKVSDMSIDQKYKMELLGMISAIGFVHENELSTNLASLGTDCISRQAAIDALNEVTIAHSITDFDAISAILDLPPIQHETIKCKDCKHYWIHKCMDSMPIERCDFGQTFYDPGRDFCSLAERREDG